MRDPGLFSIIGRSLGNGFDWLIIRFTCSPDLKGSSAHAYNQKDAQLVIGQSLHDYHVHHHRLGCDQLG